MRTICSREIFTKKCRQQQNFDSDPKEAWHYNHVTFTPIAKNFMLYCRLINMLSMLYVRLTIKVKVAIPESFKVGWYSHKITGSSHLKIGLNSVEGRWKLCKLEHFQKARTKANLWFIFTKINCRLPIIFLYKHFEYARICIVSIGPLTRLGQFLTFLFFAKTELELLNIVFETSLPKGFLG